MNWDFISFALNLGTGTNSFKLLKPMSNLKLKEMAFYLTLLILSEEFASDA